MRVFPGTRLEGRGVRVLHWRNVSFSRFVNFVNSPNWLDVVSMTALNLFFFQEQSAFNFYGSLELKKKKVIAKLTTDVFIRRLAGIIG